MSNISQYQHFRTLYDKLTSADSQKTYLWAFGLSVLVYLAELGTFTYFSDYFYDMGNIRPPSDMAHAGRFLSEFIRYFIFGGASLPSFFLLLGLLFLSIAGNVIAHVVFEIENLRIRILSGLLLALHPFILTNFSFVFSRHTTPLAMLLVVLTVAYGGMEIDYKASLIRLVGFYLSLFVIQSAINLASVIVVFWCAARIMESNELKNPLRRILLPRFLEIILSLILHKVSLNILDWSGIFRTTYLNRYGGNRFPISIAEIFQIVNRHSAGIYDYFFSPDFLFPISVKVLLFLLVVLCGAGVFMRILSRTLSIPLALVSLALLALSPWVAHGFSLIFYPPEIFLERRILFTYSGVSLGFALYSWISCSGKLKNFSTLVVGVVAFIFSVQVNNWHQFALLQNQVDFDISQQISHRIEGHPNFAPNSTLALVGRMQNQLPLYYEVARSENSTIAVVNKYSAYAIEWSKYRILIALLRFRVASQPQMKFAEAQAKDMPLWPHPESVRFKDGIFIVKLGSQ